MAVVIVSTRDVPDPPDVSPYVVRGFDASFGHKSGLIVAKGGDELADEQHRPRRRLSSWITRRPAAK